MQIGYALSSEEHAPRLLVENAIKSEKVGFEFVPSLIIITPGRKSRDKARSFGVLSAPSLPQRSDSN